MENDASKNPPGLTLVTSESMGELRRRLIQSTDAEERQQLVKEIETRFAYYSFRAECTGDVIQFCHNTIAYAMQKDEHFGALQVRTDPRFHESEVEFRSTLGLETLRGILCQQQDSHVILQTLRPVPLEQNDCKRDYSIHQRSIGKEKLTPTPPTKVGFSITVFDEAPDKIICALMDEWEQPFNIDEPNKKLLEEASDYIFKHYQGQTLDNHTLLRMSNEADAFMQIHCSERYTGRVRVRRGRKEGNEYKYRYVM